jgi:hypothetical protein
VPGKLGVHVRATVNAPIQIDVDPRDTQRGQSRGSGSHGYEVTVVVRRAMAVAQ